MPHILELSSHDWQAGFSSDDQAHALQCLEHGGVLLMPRLAFPLQADEGTLLTESVLKAKNVSFDTARDTVRGADADAQAQLLLQGLLHRFATSTRTLVDALLPSYRAGLQQARASFRPSEIEGRPTSWRKDDTRLHIDSFPSSPTQGKRILRVFTNINPTGQPRVWRLGEPFEDVARRFLPKIAGPKPGSAAVMKLLGITKSHRSAYDHYMLQLHDAMKADLAYQQAVSQRQFDFMPGSTWLTFTDQVSHAAMSGQFLLEQTFLLDVQALAEPAQSPLAVLERLVGKPLTAHAH